MRPESTLPRSRRRTRSLSGRARAVLVVIVIGLFALLLSVRGIANFVTDYLWFDAIGFDGVWRTVLFSQIVLAVIFIAIFAVLCWVNLWLADRLAPAFREPSPEEEAVARFREVVGQRWGLIRIAITALFAMTRSGPGPQPSGATGCCSPTVSTSVSTTLTSGATSGSSSFVCRSFSG